MKKVITICAVVGLIMVACGMVQATTATFTAADVKAAVGSLSDSSNQWGLWAVRAIPVITGGSFTITGSSTNQAGWGSIAPSTYSWSGYGTNCAWFYDESGSEVSGNPANPLYVVIDKPADTFTSYSGNTVTAVDNSTVFSFNFTLSSGAIWNGQVNFLVDGSKYTAGTISLPGTWVADFFGNYDTAGGLTGNTGVGYTTVPEPATMSLLAIGALSLIRRKK
ncbi:MAG: PEP-CTERM sorting domain-containing protein [Planctomycetaceae bacterium]|nr:PEP-CTERM sorting domain-containing protein [Planctomycetaceae bacterium]